jgi:alpha-maltose-1-phosphate synthase
MQAPHLLRERSNGSNTLRQKSVRPRPRRGALTPLHAHFVNENIGGHATMHSHLRQALSSVPELEATFFDVPERSFLERLAAVPVPGLGHLDLDLHPLRGQLASSASVQRHLRRLPVAPDVLHIYTHNAALLSVSHMRRIPTVVSLDATNRQNAYRLPQRKPTRFTRTSVALVGLLERRIYRAARRVVTHSRWAADSVMSYGVAPDRIEVIPFGITTPPLLARADRGERLPRIVFVGTSMERKGGWRLLRLWRHWLAGRADLTLVTPVPVPAEPGLEVRNDVCLGDGKLEQILAESDILAFPGEIDAFGYAILEAMAAELPVVAVRQAAVPELVEDGETGALVPPADDEAFARALLRLVDDPAARSEMGRAGRKRLLERFDARITTAQLVEVLRAAAA